MQLAIDVCFSSTTPQARADAICVTCSFNSGVKRVRNVLVCGSVRAYLSVSRKAPTYFGVNLA